MAFPSLQECAAALDPLTPAVLSAAAGSVVILGLAALAAAMMRRASAAARHQVWLLGLSGALLLPILSAALPGWHILPRTGVAADRPVSRPAEPVAISHVAAPTPTPVPAPPEARAQAQTTVQPSAESNTEPATAVLPPAESTHTQETIMNATKIELPQSDPPMQTVAMTPPAAAAQPSAPVSAASEPAQASAARSGGIAWNVWLLLCWPVGSLLVLGRVFLGHLSLWWLRRSSVRVTEGELFDLLGRLRRELGLRRKVELLSSPTRTMPMTWGLWRARLLVPEQAADWPADQQRDVLLHELGHIRRWDCLTQLLSQIACALYWFNPLAWIADRRMQIERERTCDDLVLNSGTAAPAYARHLLASVSSAPAFRLAGPAAVAMARPSTLEERMRAILDVRLNRRGMTARGTLATALLLALALVPVAALKAQQEPPQGVSGNSAGRSARDEGGSTPQPGGLSGGSTAQPGGVGEGRTARPPGGGEGAESPATTRPTIRGGRTSSSFGGPGVGGRTGSGGGGDSGFGSSGFGTGGGFARGGGGLGAPALGDGPTCALDATIYDVRLPVEMIGRLDVGALAKASETAEAFEKALAGLGTTRPMYRANQSVRLSGDVITIGSEVPTVTSSRMTDRGQSVNSVQYQSTGAVFTLAGRAGAAGGVVDLDLGIQVSATTDSAAVIAEKVTAPMMRRATLSHKGPFQPGKSFVILSVDAGSPDKDGKAVAYICRITMGEPQHPAPAPK